MKRFIKSAVTLSALLAFIELCGTNQAAAELSARRREAIRNKVSVGSVRIGGTSTKDSPVTRAQGGVGDRVADRIPEDNLPRLAIKKVTAVRDGAKINITAVVNNIAAKELPFAYKITKWTGAGWTWVGEGGTRMIQAGATMDVHAEIAPTKEALRLKFTIVADKYVSKEFTLAAKPSVFVVRYSTRDGRWVETMNYKEHSNPDRLIGEAAQNRAKELQALGFATRTKIKDIFLTPYYRIVLTFASQQEQVRTFDTADEAARFVSSLRRLTKDISGGRTQRGVDVKTTEQ